MPGLPDVAAYIEALRPRILSARLEGVRLYRGVGREPGHRVAPDRGSGGSAENGGSVKRALVAPML